MTELLSRKHIVLCGGVFFPKKLEKFKSSDIEIITELFGLEDT